MVKYIEVILQMAYDRVWEHTIGRQDEAILESGIKIGNMEKVL